MAAALAATVLGCVVLLGWLLRVPTLVTVIPGAVAMQPNTAIGFVLVGLAVLADRRVVLGAALLGALALADYAGADTGTSTLFFAPWTTTHTYRPGLMSPATACSFILCAGVLNKARVRAATGILVTVVGAVALLGYLSGARASYSWGAWTDMAVHTSAGFTVLGAAIVQTAQLRPTNMVFVTTGGMAATGVGLAFATGIPLILGYAVAFAVAMVVSNIRSQRLREAKTELAVERLAHAAMAERTKTFVGIVCHDLRSPLNQVAQLARLTTVKSSGVTMDDVVKAAKRVHGSIEAIERTYGTQQGARNPVTLASLANDVLESLAMQVSEHGASVHINGKDTRVPEGMRTVLLNLVGNALKYGGHSPRITVTGKVLGPIVRVSVRDHGRGFEPRQAKRLFEVGFRAHDSTPGHGLGLAFCRQLVVAEFGGRIWAESPGPGKGALFVFEVPLVEDAGLVKAGDRG